MLGSFLLAFVRNLRANKAMSLINVASLALGLLVFAMAFLYVQRELSYDREWPNAERIYRLIVEQRGLPSAPDGVFTAVDQRSFPALLDYFPEQIEAATRFITQGVYLGDGSFTYPLTFVDPAYAEIFPLEVLEGSLERVLENPGMIALSEAQAEAFGSAGRVGQRLLLKGRFNGGAQEFEVGAIFRLPKLTVHSVDMLTVIGEHAAALFAGRPSWEGSIDIWLTLRPGERLEDFNAQMPIFIDRAVTAFSEALPPGKVLSELLSYRFQPLLEMHLNPVGFESSRLNFGDKSKVLTFAVVGLLVLLVGASNSASLSLASVLNRRREIGIRKACGAGKGDVLLQFLGESVLLALLTFALAMALQQLLLAPVMTLLNVRAELSLQAVDLGALLVVAVFVGLFNGAYPAFVLSEVRPQSVELLGIPLVAGRLLDPQRDAQTEEVNPGMTAPTQAVMLNRRAAQVLGFASPEAAVDQLIYQRSANRDGRVLDLPLRIVGVVEDSLYSSLHRRPVPEAYMVWERSSTTLVLLRYEDAAAEDIERRVTELYQEHDAYFNLIFMTSRVEDAFLQERSESRLLLIAAGMALFLSCIGLYGLAAATMARSVKEVGVRKVLGASAGRIVLLFLWRFSRPILLANLVAWPVAGWFVLRWIQQFPYQLDLAWLPPIFLGASLLVLLVAWLTVSWVTAQAALRAPVQSLRYE